MSGVLVVFAKLPRPGSVKTRLCPPFTPEQACEFYERMLDDVCASCVELAPKLALDLVLAVHPPDACGELAGRVPRPFRVVRQHGADLAQRMAQAFSQFAAEGAAPILIRGSDSPTLPPSLIEDALQELSNSDLVLSPDPDGGYNLIGMNRTVPGVFNHAMSTSSVLNDTISDAKRLGLRVSLLEQSFDIDVYDDIAMLAEHRNALAKQCTAFLDASKLWPKQNTT